MLALASDARDPGDGLADPGERPGMPAVAERPFAADPDEPRRLQSASFASWSRRNGAPRILLFWNVALTDEASSRSRLRVRDETVTVARRGIAGSRRDMTVEDERTTGGPAAWIDREEGEALENGFVETFVDAGANLVDRAALMRKASTTQTRDDRADQQFIEALAMQQGIDYLVEVLPQYSNRSATGLNFTVRIVHLPSSRVIARFRSEGRPVAGPERLVARAGGFRRERDERMNPHDIAAALAAEAMQHFR